MITKIPETTEIKCDGCGKMCKQVGISGDRVVSLVCPPIYKQEGQIKIRQHGLDITGSPACDASVSFDFCDHCLNVIIDAINKEMLLIKKVRANSGKSI